MAAATTIGLEPTRTTNQDAYGTLFGEALRGKATEAWGVFCLADGMGGMAAGEVASEVAVRAVLAEAAGLAGRAWVRPAEQVPLVRGWVRRANEKVFQALLTRDARGGTTLLCAFLAGRRLAAAHVGDGRLYLLRAGETLPALLTRDHSRAVEPLNVPPEEARYHPDRSQLTRALGGQRALAEAWIDTFPAGGGGAALEPGDVLLFCTDGLWEPVVEEEMMNAVRAHGGNLHAAANTLLALALTRGAPDNATVMLARVDVAASG